MTSLEQRFAEIKHDFKTKYEYAKTALERQINATRKDFENKVSFIKTSWNKKQI